MEPKTVTANGLRFGYLERGEGPLVLLVHGFPDTAYTWDKVMPALADAGYRAVAPFTRGYRPTEVPADGAYDVETLARDVLALIDAFGGSAIVVGHDWGAAAAYAAAAMEPERMKLLVTVGVPHPRSLLPTPWLMWKVRHFVVLRLKSAPARMKRDDFAYLDVLIKRWSPAWQYGPEETARVKHAFADDACLDASLAYYRQLSARMTPAQRSKITVPTVAFAGEHDGTLAPRAFEKARTLFTGSYEVVQMPGGHFMHREHPEHFATELVRTLREHQR
jgi:pimeloyl-ACP methyl ester carboxylesterase